MKRSELYPELSEFAHDYEALCQKYECMAVDKCGPMIVCLREAKERSNIDPILVEEIFFDVLEKQINNVDTEEE